jgi:hypothetical protein
LRQQNAVAVSSAAKVRQGCAKEQKALIGVIAVGRRKGASELGLRRSDQRSADERVIVAGYREDRVAGYPILSVNKRSIPGSR